MVDSGQFLAIVPKHGADIVALTMGKYKGNTVLSVRVWKGDGGGSLNTTHGIGLAPWLWGKAIPCIERALNSGSDDPPEDIDKPTGQILRVQRQEFKGIPLLAVRVYLKNATRPSRNGLTVRPEIWLALLPHIRHVLEDSGK